jgi:hypothetical protein
MQVDRVGGVTDGVENGAFAIVGIGQHRQRLVAVGGDHDVIVCLAAAVAVVDDDAVGVRSIDVAAQPSRS